MHAARFAAKTFGAAVFASFLLADPGVFAEDAKPPAGKGPLMREDLTGIAGKEAIVLTVEYAPGASSAAHRHDADVFVYVLEGSIIMGVDGQSPVTLTAGQTFHEKPGDTHRVSANASKTAPAKFVVFMVKDKGKPVTVPVPAN